MVDRHITEDIVVPIGNPSTQANFTLTDVDYSVAINGQPFFIASTDERPYRRATAKYRKDQVDQTTEPGEQTLTGWWIRSQSSFHQGQGIKYFEPAQADSLKFQYTESKGLDVWDKGAVTLLKDVDISHETLGLLKSNSRPNQHLRSIKWTQSDNTYEGVLLHDEYDIDKIFPQITASVTNKALTSNVATLTTSAAHGMAVGFEVVVSGVDATFDGTYTITAVTSDTFSYAKTAADVASTAVSPAGTAISQIEHFVNYNTGGAYKVYAMCDDGDFVYWITLIDDAGTDKTAMYKRKIDSSAVAVEMFKTTSVVVTDACMEFTKERIVATINNKVFEISPSASALPTAVYTHPVDNFSFTSITSSGSAIYVAGFTGSQSNIQKFTLSTAGVMPTLTSAITAAEMPSGELIYKIYYYLGYMVIGTSKGVRVAVVSDQDGSISYGPLIFESEQPVYDIAARGSYVFCATNVDGAPGVSRIDLAERIGTLSFAYAWDAYYFPETVANRVTGHLTTACAFLNGTERIVFCTNKVGSTGGKVYIQSDTRLVYQGSLTTGRIRYNTLEPKLYKLVRPRIDLTYGSLAVLTISANGSEASAGAWSQGSTVEESTTPYPVGAQEYLSYKFTLGRSTTDTTKGPVFNGYQIKALPATPRQRIIQLPLYCYDQEADPLGNQVGYEDRAYDRIKTLETIEATGDTVRLQDFRTGETVIATIEEVDFMSMTPPGPRFNGFGGLLTITLRTV